MTSKEKARLAGLELEVYQLLDEIDALLDDIDALEQKFDELLTRPVRLPSRVHMTPSLTWIGYTRTKLDTEKELGE